MSTGTMSRGTHHARRSSRRRARSWQALLAVAAACICSCSTPPTAEEGLFAQPLPCSVSLQLAELPAELEPYGTAKEWHDSLLAVFETSRLCQGISATDDADVVVTVTVTAMDPTLAEARTEIDVASAFVTAIVWSCVPPLHLFVRDVAVFPDLSVKVAWMRRGGAGDNRNFQYAPPVYTSYLQRYPFFSWETLGSIVVPSFVFSSGERDHMLSTIAQRVRIDVAREVATQLNDNVLKPEDDLLRDVTLQRVQDELIINAERSADLHTIVLRLGDRNAELFPTHFLPPVPRGEKPPRIDIRLDRTKLLEAPRPTFLRLEATARTINRHSEHYTLRIDDDAPSVPARRDTP